MKKFTFMLAAALIAVTGFAKVPAGKAVRTLQSSAPVGNVVAGVKTDAARAITGDMLNAPAKAAEDYEVITTQPAGEVKTYLRGGQHYFVQNNSLYYGAQSGTIEITWGENNDVYFKDIVSGKSYGTWVKGTVNEAGTEITVPLHQNVLYVAQYDACIELTLLNYISGTGWVLDSVKTDVTFTINNDVLELQGTALNDVSLCLSWTDDGSKQDYGDFGSIYTPYTPNLDLVTLPEGLETTEMPLTGKFFASVSASAEEVAVDKTVKVAQDGDTFYFQGIANEFPEAWVKGTLADGVVTIPVTYLGTIDNQNVWVCGYSSSGPVDVEFIYDEDRNTFELDGYFMLNPNELSMVLADLKGYYQALYIGTRPDPITPPAGLETEEVPYVGQQYDGSNTNDVEGTVELGIDGYNYYIKGLISEVPDAWVMGTLNDEGNVIIPMGQYVGVGDYGSVYVLGDDNSEDADDDAGPTDVIFSLDNSRGTLTLQNNLYANGKKDAFYYYSVLLSGLVIGNQSDEIWVAADQGYSNQEEVTEITIGEGVTGTIVNGGTTAKYYTSDVSLRLYAGGSLTIASEKTMAKIVLTMTGSAKQKAFETDIPTYALSGTEGTWEGESKKVTFTVPTGSGNQARIQKIQIFYFDYTTTMVELPEGVETEEYMLTGTDTYYERTQTYNVKVGFKDNYVYIQGLSENYVPDAWVRGEIVETPAAPALEGENDVVTYEFPQWYMGTYYSYFGSYEMLFSGATMTYNKTEDKFYNPDGFQTLANGQYAFDEMADVTIFKPQEREATPADPENVTLTTLNTTYPNVKFTIPVVDTDGEYMVTDKLSFVVYRLWDHNEGRNNLVTEQLTFTPDLYTEIDEEMSEIPYSFTDDYDIINYQVYLNWPIDEILSWNSVGIQSIYRGNGVEHRSNIVWAQNPSAITNVNNVVNGVATYFDLTGRKVSENTPGILIKQVRDEKGNILETTKVLNK